jgi:hypothetical protein
MINVTLADTLLPKKRSLTDTTNRVLAVIDVSIKLPQNNASAMPSGKNKFVLLNLEVKPIWELNP